MLYFFDENQHKIGEVELFIGASFIGASIGVWLIAQESLKMPKTPNFCLYMSKDGIEFGVYKIVRGLGKFSVEWIDLKG